MERERPRKRRRLAALAATTLTLALGVADANAGRMIYGVVPQDGAVPVASDLDMMPGAGIDGIRLMAHWGTAETTPGTYDWSTLDAMVRETTNRGIKPMLFLYGSPLWATELDGYDCAGGESPCTVYPPRSDATRAAFAAFSKAAVERYGPGGQFWRVPGAGEVQSSGVICGLVPGLCPDDPVEPPPPPPSPEPPPGQPPCGCTQPSPLRVWQVWNEQNSPKYFAPKVKVKLYAKMLRDAGNAIHSADRGADVMIGGMWGPKSARKVVLPVTQYMKRLYRVKGIKRSFDSIALHPYAASAQGSLAALELGRELLDKAGDRTAGIWVSELGWASGGPRSNAYVKGMKGQAKLLKRALKSFQKRSRALRLRGVYWYSWRDLKGGSGICDWCGHAGLRARNGSAKPAWRAFSQAARR
jgi:hypothetical protein